MINGRVALAKTCLDLPNMSEFKKSSSVKLFMLFLWCMQMTFRHQYLVAADVEHVVCVFVFQVFKPLSI